MSATERPERLDARVSIVVVLVSSVLWLVASMTMPDLMRALHLDPRAQATEGPFELFENGLLACCIAAWVWVAFVLRGDPRRAVLAALLALQITLVLGEEIDWAGLPIVPDGQRNVRRLLQLRLGLSERDAALVVLLGLGVFFTAPLVPLARVQRALDRIAPVRADLGDVLALSLLPLAWLVMERIDRGPSTELLQTGAYLVLLVVSLRAVLATRGPITKPRDSR